MLYLHRDETIHDNKVLKVSYNNVLMVSIFSDGLCAVRNMDIDECNIKVLIISYL